MHALAVSSELMSLAARETQDVQLHEALQHPPTASKAERPLLLAQSISAVLRRALPALRISSMWLLSNNDYLARFDSTSASFGTSDASLPPEVCAAVRGFWMSYANFANALARAFPAHLLPDSRSHVLLEEDIDMLGFAPLKRRMKEAPIGKAAQEVSGALADAAATSSTMHPNEEQVLRIADLLADAGLLAHSEVRYGYIRPEMRLTVGHRPGLPCCFGDGCLHYPQEAPQSGVATLESGQGTCDCAGPCCLADQRD